MRWRYRWMLLVGFLGVGGLAQAADLPPDRVLARLPRVPDLLTSPWAGWAATLRQEPRRAPLAAALAEELLREAARQGRDHPLRQATRLLSPWREADLVPYEVALARARVAWRRGDLVAAFDDLQDLLGVGPDDHRIWQTLAAIQDEQGDYPAAFRRCLPLVRGEDAVEATLCIASANRFGAEAGKAASSLRAALREPGAGTPDQRRRAHVVLADVAREHQDAAVEEEELRRALAAVPEHAETLARLADRWLASGRRAEVAARLDAQRGAPALHLRWALAQDDPQARERATRQLEAYFLAAASLDDPRHMELAARLELELRARPERALALAARAWSRRRSPPAARLLVRAARAAGRPEATSVVRAWAARAGVVSPALRAALEAEVSP